MNKLIKIGSLCLCIPLLLSGCGSSEEKKQEAVKIAREAESILLSENSTRVYITETYKHNHDGKELDDEIVKYAMEEVEADYKDHAYRTAAIYKENNKYDRETMNLVLMNEGFNNDEIEYAVNKLYK